MPQAVDLSNRSGGKSDAELALQDVAAQQQVDKALARTREWDRLMRRAFKGIMPRREAHAFLKREVH